MPAHPKALVRALLLLAAFSPALAVAGDPLTERQVIEAIQAARKSAGLAPLERRAPLDAAALSRAKMVAAAPHADRLELKQSIDAELRSVGATPFRRAVPYLVLKRGYDDYARAFVEGWQDQPERWNELTDESFDAFGLAVHRSADGWWVLAAILIEDAELVELPDRILLERATLQAINDVRRSHGLHDLAEDETLTKLARGHSEDMARRSYFAHQSPEGADSKQRVHRQGIAYTKLAENIHKNRGMPDPAAFAVKSWMESRGHRKSILTPDFTRTGLGVAIDENGAVYFTQLFLLPPG